MLQSDSSTVHVIQKNTLFSKKLDISWNLFHYSKSDCSKEYTVTIGDSNLKLQLRCFVSRCYWLSACPKLDLSRPHRRSVDLTQHPLSFRNTAEQSAHRQSIKTCWMRFFNWPVDWFHIRFPYSFQLNNLCLWSGSRDAQAGEIQKGWEPTLKLGSLRVFTGRFNFGKHVTFTQIPEIAIIRLIGIWTFLLLVNHQLSDPIGVDESQIPP